MEANATLLAECQKNNWDYRFMSSSFSISAPADANKFGFRLIDTTSTGTRKKNKKYKDLLIPFQYVEDFPVWVKSANWNSISDVMGRYEDMSVYSNSAAQDQSIVISYLAESETSSDDGSIWSLEFINKLTRRLQSLVFPQMDSFFSPPMKALLNIGKMYIDYPVIIKSISIPQDTSFFWKTGETLYRKMTIELRSSYPLWQSISAESIYNSDNGSTKCFARKEYQRKSYNY